MFLNIVVMSADSSSSNSQIRLPWFAGIHAFIRWSMTQLKKLGTATQPCLTPLLTEAGRIFAIYPNTALSPVIQLG